MSQPSDYLPTFKNPPVIETRLGIQFEPIREFRSGLFGLLWQQCFADWKLGNDSTPKPRFAEPFGDKRLRRVADDDDIPGVRMTLNHQPQKRRIEFQANQFYYSWVRDKSQQPRYSEAKQAFADAITKLDDFVVTQSLPKLQCNLWEITYINSIAMNDLWRDVTDWCRIFPNLFGKPGPQPSDCKWASFNGEWYFELPEQWGRIRFQLQKSVRAPSDEVVLLVIVTTRGQVGANSAPNWSEGMDRGHQCAVRAFYELASNEARTYWGASS